MNQYSLVDCQLIKYPRVFDEAGVKPDRPCDSLVFQLGRFSLIIINIFQVAYQY